MSIEDILKLIKDPKLNIEIIEEKSGASFGFFNDYYNTYVPLQLLKEKVVSINAQYVNGKRLLVIKF